VPRPRIENRTEDNTHVVVRIPELVAEGTFESRIELEYVTSNRSFKLDQGITSVNLDQSTYVYCKDDKFWETKDPLVRRTSESIRGSSRDVAEFLTRAFAWVRDNVKLRQPEPKRLGAAHTIRELTGDCDELSDLFIALCRAANIPSRRVVGLFYHGHTAEPRPFDWHAWAEVQVSGDVWIPFDPSLNFLAATSDRHLPRCCMGRRSDYPLRRLIWRSQPQKSPILNDDDVESVTPMPG
jgi:transglutaminase-like putative cysteine protease